MIALNWGPWGEVGMARLGTKAHAMALRSGELPLSTAASFEAFERALSLALFSTPASCAQFAICRMAWSRTVWRGGSIATAATALDDALEARSAALAGRRMQRGGA